MINEISGIDGTISIKKFQNNIPPDITNSIQVLFVHSFSYNGHLYLAVYVTEHNTIYLIEDAKDLRFKALLAGINIKETVILHNVSFLHAIDLYILKRLIDESITYRDSKQSEYSPEALTGVSMSFAPALELKKHLTICSHLPRITTEFISVINSVPVRNNSELHNILSPVKIRYFYKGLHKEFTISNPYVLLEIYFTKYLIDIERAGMPVNIDTIHKLYNEIQSEYTSVMNFFNNLGINPFTQEGIGLIKQANLNTKLDQLWFVKPIHDKLKEILRNIKNGRVYPKYNQISGKTWLITTSTPNIQNVKSVNTLRAIFKAPEGYTFLIADYPQIELMILSSICGDAKMLNVFKSGGDIHTYVASIIKDEDKDLITVADRKKAKSINYGIIYGMSAKRLLQYCKKHFNIEFSHKEALKIIKNYMSEFPAIARKIQSIGPVLKKYGCMFSSTLLGRKIKTTNYTSSLNYPVQASRSEIMKLAVINLYRLARTQKQQVDFRIVNLIHDEIVLEVKKEHADICKDLLIRAMTEIIVKLLRLPCRIDVKESEIWIK